MKAKKIFFFVLFIYLLKANVNAQLSFQINTGLMNYGGDLQPGSYTFNQSRLTAGAALLYSFHNFSVRGAFTYGGVQADDAKSKFFASRNLNFKSSVTEFNTCLEYDIRLHEDSKFIPYIFAGIGVFHFNPYTFYNSKKVFLQPLGTEGEGSPDYPNKKLYALTQSEYPLGLGIKYKLTNNLFAGLEFNTRLISTDYLDDVSGVYPDKKTLLKERGQLAVDLSFRGNEIDPTASYPAGRSRGNPNHNDNFYTSVITLTYIIPDLKSGTSSAYGRRMASINCPKKVY